MISDPRFARLHTDARFQVFPNKQRKVEIDERFKGVPSTGYQACIWSSSVDVRLERLYQDDSYPWLGMQACSQMSAFSTRRLWTSGAERHAQRRSFFMCSDASLIAPMRL